MEEFCAMALAIERAIPRGAAAFIVAMWFASAWLLLRAIGLKPKSQICTCGIEGCLAPENVIRLQWKIQSIYRV
jgi:hypothetical protein